MSVLFGVLWPLERFNTAILAVGRWISVVALALMVIVILSQVFFRYAVGDALNWSEEAARFGMLWMTGLMAPLAYRIGGFVAIDMLERALPRVLAGLLALFLLAVSLWVLIVFWERGLNNHVDTLSGRGCSASLRWPFGIEIGKCGAKFQNNFQFASLWVGMNLLILVNIELIIRQLITFAGHGDKLTRLTADEDIAGAN